VEDDEEDLAQPGKQQEISCLGRVLRLGRCDPKFTGLKMPELEEERLITLIANFDSVSPRDD
jgi:hypothetical protein